MIKVLYSLQKEASTLFHQQFIEIKILYSIIINNLLLIESERKREKNNASENKWTKEY